MALSRTCEAQTRDDASKNDGLLVPPNPPNDSNGRDRG